MNEKQAERIIELLELIRLELRMNRMYLGYAMTDEEMENLVGG